MSKKNQTKLSNKEITEKFCNKCDYSENCETNGNWETCPHFKRVDHNL